MKRIILLAALLLTTCAEAPRPNLFLITVDTLRADRIGAYGYAQAETPAIDSLARRGRMFLQATTPFPRTTPAIASLFTGLEPAHHGSREIWQPFTHGTTLAEVLQSAGYTTIGVSANPAAGGKQHLDRGFDHFVEADALPDDAAAHVVDAVLAVVDSLSSAQGLFVWVHFMDPHFPYDPPQPVEAPACRQLMQDIAAGRLRMGHVEGDALGSSSRALKDCSRLYDAEIHNADLHIGRLLDSLQAAGLTQGAFTLLTSDHGENLGEDGLYYGHGPSLHDASVRVPLILVGPGVETGADGLPIRLEDVAPTLLSLLGLSVARDHPPTAIDGVDLAGRVRGQATHTPPPLARIEAGSALNVSYTDRIFSGRAHSRSCIHDDRFSLCSFPGKPAHLYDHQKDPWLEQDVSAGFPEARERLLACSRRWQPEQVRERAVRDGRFKMIERPRLEGGYAQFLYDLRQDPAEQLDATARLPVVARRLAQALQAWSTVAPSVPAATAPEDAKTLRSLGYIE